MTLPTPSISDGDYDTLRVALCQIQTEEWEVEANFRRTLDALDSAGAQNAEFAVTPECVLHGYGQGSGEGHRQRLLEAAEPIGSPRLQAIAAKAKEHRMHILLGFMERTTQNALHNSAAFISPEGEIIDVYRKVHCRPNESAEQQGCFTPGDRFIVTDYASNGKKFKIGAMICFDREIPESARCLRALGAEIVLCPLATNTSNIHEFCNRADNEMITRCRAAENEVFIIVVNHAARYNGGSFVVGPSGEILHQMHREPGVHVMDIPVGVIAQKFHNNPLGWMGWGYRKPDVYGKSLIS